MSELTGESSGSTNNNFALANKFFAEQETVKKAPPPPKVMKTPNPPRMPIEYSSRIATWIQDQSFEIQLIEEESEENEFQGSPLPSSVCSWSGFVKNLSKKRENPMEIEENEGRKRKSDSPQPKNSPEPPSLFKQFEEKLAETRQEIQENPRNWTKIRGILMEKSSKNPEPVRENSVGPKSKFDEIMDIFEPKNTDVYYSVELDHGYNFDWKLFDSRGFQYIVFTKICEDHPIGHQVEMRKEETICSECSSTNLSVTIRLTVPLDLSGIPIPIFDDIQVHVSFLIVHLLEKSALDSIEMIEKSCDFSKKTCQKMWILYQKMVEERKTNWEYKKWFDGCKEFVKTSLHSKTLFLHHGTVIRRKIDELAVDSKKRCLIFAHLFDLYD